MTIKTYTIKRNRSILINTDPLRRCYNGCYFSSEMGWSGWETLYSGVSEDDVERKLAFWRSLNNYAIEQRGKGALIEYVAELE